ncbi:AAA family ATPase [Paraburkholderia sp. MMS20-SJTR3]|uniref:AAA family ATPase n=1 Tax=Paraburkholderia sejongensis TaxID=2886946 RepID=A0ABS8K5Y7_9BURK|nr:AAA family ATPase [Paraburkholderia sp. MMS20-SJTR3]MCC8397586.1 AAA family ATPase [Paraburkholderia sp. MMS20-SJTR3]
MYVRRITACNFRTFGAEAEGKNLNLVLNRGLNVLVGENDAGKSSIVDALRYALSTTSNDYLRIEDLDFHVSNNTRADELTIEVEFADLSRDQKAALIDWLSIGRDKEPYLVVHLRARRRTDAVGSRNLQPIVRTHSGLGGNGPEIGAAARELIRATYLKPLRDAVSELRPKKGSRLSQVLRAQTAIKDHQVNNFDSKNPDAPPNTLVEVMAQAQHRISGFPVIKDVRNRLNTNYLNELSFEDAPLQSEIQMASEPSLVQLLEKMELTLGAPPSVGDAEACERGLGYNNVLFMAAELLLLGSGMELALLLIEEPEAHLHPQLQARVLEMLSARAVKDGIQILLSTHSPNIAASAAVESIILVCKGSTFPLRKSETKLDDSDYKFLSRFLDVTKANLFFARGVLIVEGPAEELLLPALAEACGRSFTANGISVVNVGSVGLFRYARIFQSATGVDAPIPVACVTDRDIVPDGVSYIQGRLDKEKAAVPVPKGRKRHSNRKEADFTPEEAAAHVKTRVDRAAGGNTKVFVSDRWTLEYDLLISGCRNAMFIGIHLADAEDSNGILKADVRAQTKQKATEFLAEQDQALVGNELIAIDAYELLADGLSKAISAQYTAELIREGHCGKGDELFKKLPPYLMNAFNHLVPHVEPH